MFKIAGGVTIGILVSCVLLASVAYWMNQREAKKEAAEREYARLVEHGISELHRTLVKGDKVRPARPTDYPILNEQGFFKKDE